MKRLLRISFNSFIYSLIPILQWFFLGMIIDKNLINVFSLTYPLQFIYALIVSIFGIGANIYKEKNKNENSVWSGLILEIFVGFVIFGMFLLFLKPFINFMNFDYNTYKEFALYSIIQLYISTIFGSLMQKLYFEGREEEANIHCILFSFINLLILILTSLLTKNKYIIIFITLLSIIIYTIYLLIKEYKKFKLEFHVLTYMKYESVNIVNNILFFLIFIFGLSNAFEYGTEYMVAINFVALITDMNWDAFDAINTVATIDISKNEFNYKEHKKNSYYLLMILLLIVAALFIITFNIYKPNLKLTFIYLLFELINFTLYPIYKTKTCYLQLEWSPVKTTTNKFIASLIRFIITFIKSPFCTGIGQVVSAIYQYISLNIIFDRNYKITKNGIIVKR